MKYGKVKWECKFCGEMFYSKYNIHHHILKEHEGEIMKRHYEIFMIDDK